MIALFRAGFNGVLWFVELIAAWLNILFGITWRAPAWFHWIGMNVSDLWRWSNTHRTLALKRFGVTLTLLAAAAWGMHWYQHLPKPVENKATVVNPALTRLVDGQWLISPLIVTFDGSVAPLDKIGKTVTTAIDIYPKVDGIWQWENDRRLKFIPRADWDIGVKHQLKLPHKGLLASHVTLDEYALQFKTEPFAAAVTQTEFYQDPTDPKLKKVVATIGFTHPVDTADFEKRVSMTMQAKGVFAAGSTQAALQVTFDKFKLNAYVHSEPIAIPERDSQMTLVVDKGARAQRGGSSMESKLERAIDIPGMFNFFRISSSNLSLVRNEKFEPEQVLVLETTTGVEPKEINPAVSAYVLPVYHPKTKDSERKNPYAWRAEEVDAAILKLATPLKLAAVPVEADYATLHSYKYQADPGRYVYVRVNKGVKSFGGYVLSQAFDRALRVPEFPKELQIMYDGAILSLGGEKKVSLFSRDIEAIKYEVGRVLPSQVQHLVTQTSGDFKHPQFENDRFNEENISEYFSELKVLEKIAPGKTQYHAFDLARYLAPAGNPDGRRGLFLLKAEAYDAKGEHATGISDSRFILITDLGLLVKDSLDGSHDVFVQSINSGEPVANAKVEVMGKNGVAIASAVTASDGHAQLPNLNSFRREQTPALYLVQKSGDLSFLPFNRQDRQLMMSRFDVGGVGNAISGERLTAYLFSDRGIYRPGEEIRVGMIVKPADWKMPLAGVPLQIEVLDARGLAVKKQKIQLSQAGFEEILHTTQDTAPTGTYTFNVYIVKDGQASSLLGSTTVRVQEFLPDRMKIAAHLSQERAVGWVSPKDLKGLVTLTNLFGTPATQRRVSGTLGLFPAYPAFASYPDYLFYDPLLAKEGYTEPLADATTDDKGEAEFDLNLQRFAKATYRLRLNVQGFEAEGGRSVAAEAAVLVSPLSYLVGYKADGDLNYIHKDSKRVVELIAIDPATKKTAVKALTLQWIERRYVSVLTKQENGTYKYESKQKEIKLEEKPLAIPAAGMRLKLATDKAGSFAYVIRDQDHTELNRIPYMVAGAANITRALDKNAELQLTLSKTDYAPGEEIEMQIKAPYIGAGLITIERDKVFSYRWFKTSTNSSVQKIKVPAGLEGNGYVSVAFVRSINSDEIFMSPLSYGVAPFSVSRAKRTTQITLNTPDLAKPGQAFRIRYKTDRPAKMVIYAVDEGILQVARYKTPDPLGYFFQKRALEVRTAQILDLILPEFKRLLALAAAGGDQEGALGKNLNPFKRKGQKPVAYWSGIVEAGPKEKELVYQVPDYFNGTLRVMAVAVTPDAIGTLERKAHIRGDFVLSPNVPTFVAPGDEFDVPVSVANNVPGSGKNAEVLVELKTSPHLQVVGNSRVSLKIGEMREASTTFRVRALAKLGSADLSFTASRGQYSAKLGADLSVRPALPYMTTLNAGHFKNGKKELPVTRQMYSEHRTLNAGISPLPLGLAHGLTRYLEKYPYGCTEQLVSQALPAIVLRNRPEFGYAPATVNQSLASIISTLRSRQNADGAFGLWAANSHVDDFASVYALHFLLEAKERGLAVPADMIENGKIYLTQLANSEGASLGDERVRVYAIYVLTRTGIVTSNYAAAAQKRLETRFAKEWKKDTSAIYLAATYKLLRQDSLANKLIANAHFGEPITADYRYYYDTLTHDAQLLYILARHFPERLKSLSGTELEGMADQIAQGSYNTLSSSYTILAFDAYASALGNVRLDKYGITEVLPNGKQHAIPLPVGVLPRVDFSPEASKLRFTSSTPTTTFYLMTQAGFDNRLPAQDIKNRLEVLREYTDLKGKPIKSVKLGDEIEVHVQLRAIKNETLPSVAVVDLLPGGFEVVLSPTTASGNDNQAQPPGPRGDTSAEEANPEDSPNAQASAWQAPVGDAAKSTWSLDYADVREDRVVLYGEIGAEVKTFVYRIKATNVGNYVVPPTFGESMYDRAVQARSLGGKISVEKK